MKRNTLTLIGLFILLLIIAILVLQKPGEQSASSASAGNLFQIDSASVDKIELQAPSSSVTLEKHGAEWFVVQPINYKADQSNAGQIIHQLKNLEMKNTISSKPEKHSIFQVDSTGVQVKVYEKGMEKAAFVLGKMAETYTESYARKLNSNDVLLVEGVSNYMFNRPMKDWRDKTIFATPKESIKEIKYQYGDTTFTLIFKDSLWIVDGDNARQSIIDGLLSSLASVQADDFIDSTLTPTPKITAAISYNDTQLRFSLNKATSKYFVQSSNSPQWFIMEQWRTNQFLKHKKDFIDTGKK